MNQVQANRLVKLAEFLKTVPESKWDYASIAEIKSVDVTKQVSLHNSKLVKVNCNTTACALGWCTTVFPNRFTSNLPEILRDVQDNFVDEEDVLYKTITVKFDGADVTRFSVDLEKFFGLTRDELGQLFFGEDVWNTYGIEDCRLESVTKKDVIKFIHKLLDRHGYEVV